MPISTSCSDCGRAYKLDDRLAGKRAKCKACGNMITIPAAASAAPVMAMRAERPAPARPGSALRTSAARPAARSAPPPVPMHDDPGVPSLGDLAELEATGQPNQFSHLPPPTIEPVAAPWYAAKPVTTIADANPKVAAAYKKKMSRRAMMAGGGAGLGGIGGGTWLVLRLIGTGARAYNRATDNNRRDESTDRRNEASAQSDEDESQQIRQMMADRQAQRDQAAEAQRQQARQDEADRNAQWLAQQEQAKAQREADRQRMLQEMADRNRKNREESEARLREMRERNRPR